MKNSIRLIAGSLTVVSVSFLASCQKVQNASAEEVATRYGENGEKPEAEAQAEAAANNAGSTESGAVQTQPTQGGTSTQPPRESGNRFGFAGAQNNDPPVKPLRRDSQAYKPLEQVKKKTQNAFSNVKKEVADSAPQSVEDTIAPPPPPTRNSSVSENKIEAPTPPPAPPAPPAAPESTPQIVRLGYADSIPGDHLHVKLPGEYASLGPISVEKMDAAGNNLGTPWARGTQMQIPNPKAPGGKIYFKVP